MRRVGAAVGPLALLYLVPAVALGTPMLFTEFLALAVGIGMVVFAGSYPADLVVLTRTWAASDPLSGDLQRRGVRHLVATVRGETGVVGPLVVPGATSCLRCADLHRRDADPRWPVLAAQLTAGEAPPGGATVTCLATAVTAAVQVLALLDGIGAPATLGTTVELTPPDLLPRTRRWPAHPDCGCVPSGAGDGA